MNKFSIVALAALVAVSVSPAMAKTTSSQMMMPNCKGRMVMTDMTAHKYSTNKSWKVSHHKMMMMCEASAKAKGYHMMSGHMMGGMMSHPAMHSQMKAKMAPVVNPNGALGADKGATPNPDNNANGIHTTANPAPTPTP